MGCGASTAAVVEKSKVEKELEEFEAEEKQHYKVLLLGAGESGKSTLSKQLRALAGTQPLQPRERALVTSSIRRNTIEMAVVLCEAMETLNINFESPDAVAASKRLRATGPSETLTPALADDVAIVWSDAGAQRAWEQRSHFWILDAAPYYFAHAARLAGQSYEPTDEDAVMCRVVSSGVSVVDLREPPVTYSVVDVGGQRNERRKWIHCFDDVKAIVFVDSLAGYNQVLYEDMTKLRLHESLELFSQVVSNPLFETTPIFLVLNKKDLFEEMIHTEAPLTVCFPEYSGPEKDVHAALEFIETKYRELLAQACARKQLHVVAMSARVKLEVKTAWADMKVAIARQVSGVGSPGGRNSLSRASPNRVTSSGHPKTSPSGSAQPV